MDITQPSECILLAKPDRVDHARMVFKGSGIDIKTEGTKDTGVEIITTGTRHLGAAVGTDDFKHSYIKKKVDAWIQCVQTLATIANSEPHAAYSAYTHCLQTQWGFLCRSMPGVPALFQPLEDAIRTTFIPALLRREVNDRERDLLSLPARMGGMGILKPIDDCLVSHNNSVFVSEPLVRLVQRQEFEFDPAELSDEVKALEVMLTLQTMTATKKSSNRS